MSPADWLTSTAGVRVVDDAVIRVVGEDARPWLNGQVTNDTRGLQPGRAVYALVLDGRGKILSDVWAVERTAYVALIVPRENAALLLEHFDKYIVMEDVELAVLDEAILTVQGPRAAEIVDAAGLSGHACDRLGYGGVDVMVAAGSRDGASAELIRAAGALGGGPVDEADWELARLRAGRPRFGADFGPAHYPQEAGLKGLAVSFDKGCYLGQEVVCTLENRGQLSRRLVRLEAAGEIAPGAELRHEGKVVGQLTSTAHDPASGRWLALGYVKRAAASPGIRLDTPGGDARVVALAGEPDTSHAEPRAL